MDALRQPAESCRLSPHNCFWGHAQMPQHWPHICLAGVVNHRSSDACLLLCWVICNARYASWVIQHWTPASLCCTCPSYDIVFHCVLTSDAAGGAWSCAWGTKKEHEVRAVRC